MNVPSLASARVRRFLATEPVVWLSSVRPDGSPHLVPIWFTWDGEALVIFSKPHAQKSHGEPLAAAPRVAASRVGKRWNRVVEALGPVRWRARGPVLAGGAGTA